MNPWTSGAQIRSLMTADPWVLDAGAPLVEAAEQMFGHGFRHGLVVDGAGRLSGVVQDFDVFQHGAYTAGMSAWMEFPGAPRTVGELASRVAVVVERATPLIDALQRMIEARQDLIVVVDTGRHPVGIVTEHDGVRVAAQLLPLAVTTSDVGSAPVHTVGARQSIHAAMSLMLDRRVRHLVVTEGGVAIGVVSWRDVVAARSTGRVVDDARPRRALVSQVGQTRLWDAAKLMWDHKVGCVPIVDAAGRPVRIVTRTDVLAALVGDLTTA